MITRAQKLEYGVHLLAKHAEAMAAPCHCNAPVGSCFSQDPSRPCERQAYERTLRAWLWENREILLEGGTPKP